MSPQKTVYDRFKKTGYIMGPNHRMENALESMQPDAPPPPTAGAAPEGEGPPNLRDSGDGAESCGECANFDGRDTCEKYQARVTPNMVCDDFEPASEQDEAEGPETEDAEPEPAPMSPARQMKMSLARQAR